MPISLKVYGPANVVRRFTLPDGTSLAELAERLTRLFDGLPPRYQLRYVDDANDEISMDTEEEWHEAQRVLVGQTIRLYVIDPQQPSTVKPQPQHATAAAPSETPRFGGPHGPHHHFGGTHGHHGHGHGHWRGRWGGGCPRRNGGACGSGEAAPSSAAAGASSEESSSASGNVKCALLELKRQFDTLVQHHSPVLEHLLENVKKTFAGLIGDEQQQQQQEEEPSISPEQYAGNVVENLQPVVNAATSASKSAEAPTAGETSTPRPVSHPLAQAFAHVQPQIASLLQRLAGSHLHNGDVELKVSVTPDGQLVTEPTNSVSEDAARERGDITIVADVNPDGSIAGTQAFAGAPSSTVPLPSACTILESGFDNMRQPFWNCASCGLTDTAVCCAACARKCHAGHAGLTFRGYGCGFCDCGAGETDRDCQCLPEAPAAAAAAAEPVIPEEQPAAAAAAVPEAVSEPAPAASEVPSSSSLPEDVPSVPAAAAAPVEPVSEPEAVPVPEPVPVSVPVPVPSPVAVAAPIPVAAEPAPSSSSAPSSFSNSELVDEGLRVLVDMGFPPVLSRYCLVQTKGDVEQALEKLIGLSSTIKRVQQSQGLDQSQ